MRGPRSPSAAIIARSPAKYSSHWPGSRNAVTPLASCRSASFGSGGVFSMWKCVSTRPGSTVRPDRSTRSAPAGTGTDAAAPTAVMRSPSMTMRASSMGGRPVPSTSRACSRTSTRAGGLDGGDGQEGKKDSCA